MSPRFCIVQSLKNQRVIADKCFVAERFFDRLKGLIGTRAMKEGEGMYFPRCNDIHMWFMSMPIDVIFLRRDSTPGRFVVSSLRERVRPWKLLPLHDWSAADTLELRAGSIEHHGIREGDELCIS